MSASRLTGPPGRIRFSVPSGVEATVLGPDLSVVFRAHSGDSEANLPAGLYKVISRAADATQSTLIEVVPNDVVDVRLDPVQFASAAPLLSTRKTHEYHTYEAQRLSQLSPQPLGSGAQLFLFSRYWTGSGGKERRGSRPSHPLKGLTLRRLDGTEAVNVEQASQWVTNVPDQYAWASFGLDPGPYRLRLETKVFGVVEQSLILSPNWQTQVFALVRDIDQGPAEEHLPDLTSAAILMARPGDGFDPGSRHLTLTEIARLGLSRGISRLSQSDRDELLFGKFENPMLGIMGAHLISRTESLPPQQLSVIINNLRQLVGEHPDVEILAARYLGRSDAGDPRRFESPPMLASSWDLLVEMAAEDESLIPADGLASGIAMARWGSGAWLTWLLDALPARQEARLEVRELAVAGDAPVPREPTGAMLESGLDPATSLAMVQNQITKLDERSERLTGLEAALGRAVQSAGKGEFASKYLSSVGERPAAEAELDVKSIAKAFKLPASSVRSALKSLASKLAE